MRWILPLCLLATFVFHTAESSAEDKVIKDKDGRTVATTREGGTRTIIRDSLGRNIGSIRADGSITDNYGKVQGSVKPTEK